MYFNCLERCSCCYRKNSNLRLEHWFSKYYLFRKFRMKYFKDIEILYEKFFIISKYCPISNSNVNTVITDMNIESSSNSKKVTKFIILIIITIEIISLIIVELVIVKNRNINIRDSENNNIAANIVVK